jgi:hypothetical protein
MKTTYSGSIAVTFQRPTVSPTLVTRPSISAVRRSSDVNMAVTCGSGSRALPDTDDGEAAGVSAM